MNIIIGWAENKKQFRLADFVSLLQTFRCRIYHSQYLRSSELIKLRCYYSDHVAGIYLFKVNNENNSVWNLFILSVRRLERHHFHRSDVVIINFEQILLIILVFPLLGWNK